MEHVNRNWGYYMVVHSDKNFKVKELIINQGKGISLQRHFKRSETWVVLCGEGEIHIGKGNTQSDLVSVEVIEIKPMMSIDIPVGTWHRIISSTKPIRIIETQYGEECIEEDIERINTSHILYRNEHV